ncbi:site-specific DNA-methyltransferase (adenine-specific) OS=Streptomyces microflavus OX=1919 GN=Smic_59130 PE=4 SV=1 [Streptomyces microflavus]
MDLRGRLVTGFTKSVGDVGVLDEYTTAGIMADWWTANRYDLKALAAGGFERVLAGWVDSVEAIVDPALPPTEEGDIPAKKPTVSGADRRRAMDHPVVRALIPEFLDAVSSADTAVTEADAAYRAALEAVAEAKPAPVADAEDDADTDADEPSDGDTEATAPVSQDFKECFVNSVRPIDLL